MQRIGVSLKAAEIIEQIKSENEELIFHQSGGCCDGTVPMLLLKEDLYLDDSDVCLGDVCGIEYYMNREQFEYWKHTYITVDITEGRGSSFSLEICLGYRFLIDSRLFNSSVEKYFNT